MECIQNEKSLNTGIYKLNWRFNYMFSDHKPGLLLYDGQVFFPKDSACACVGNCFAICLHKATLFDYQLYEDVATSLSPPGSNRTLHYEEDDNFSRHNFQGRRNRGRGGGGGGHSPPPHFFLIFLQSKRRNKK